MDTDLASPDGQVPCPHCGSLPTVVPAATGGTVPAGVTWIPAGQTGATIWLTASSTWPATTATAAVPATFVWQPGA